MADVALNPNSYPSMPLAMAKTGRFRRQRLAHAGALYVGGLVFIGSNTVSDLLFAEFQWGVAQQLELPRQIIVAAQVAGGAAGNMVCIHNIVAVCAVTGLIGREGMILKRTFWPFVLSWHCRGHYRQLDESRSCRICSRLTAVPKVRARLSGPFFENPHESHARREQ